MGMRLCSLCAGELTPRGVHCPRCGAPVSPEGFDAGAAAAETVDGWLPTPQTARSAAVIAPPDYSYATAPPPRPSVRRDWPGAARAAGLAMLGGYIVAAGIGTLLSPTGSSGPVLWVAVPAALLAVALGGHWQANIADLDASGGGALGYQGHAFPLLLTGTVAVVLARAMRSRYETGRANDTLRDRLSQAVRVALALAGCGLAATLLSRVGATGGLITHAGYLSPPVGGLVIGLVAGVFAAISYDLSQLPPRVREFWLRLREPVRAARVAMTVVTVVATVGVLIALEAAPPDQLVVGDEGRRVLSGLVIAAAPNLGWWFLVACLGAPVRSDLLSGERGDGFGALFGQPAWWVPAAVLASVLLAAIAVRLVATAADPAAARHRLVSWTALSMVAAIAFLLLGTVDVSRGVGPFPVEYMIGSTSALAAILPPLWVGLASLAGYAANRALHPATRPKLS